ncbi:MAG: hypothetical protein RIS70_3050 [Planctomycetota bacterium]
MAAKKKLSVEEILAACRTPGGGGTSSNAPAEPLKGDSAGSSTAGDATAESESAPKAAEKAKPAAASKPAPAKPAGKPGAMSVADILAAARANKSGAGDAPAPAKAAPKSVEKETAKPAAAKPAAAKAAASPKAAAVAAAAKPAAPALDTASILSAARGSSKPGPISKAEAAAKGKPVEEKTKKLTVPPMPAKPTYAQTQPKAAKATETRRGFFASVNAWILGSSLALGFASLAVTQLLWVLGLARYMFPNILTEPPTRFKVGFPDVLGLGQVDERFKAQFGVWIVKAEYEGQPQIFALKSVCTHLGCTPNWLEAEQKYKCPCHGSGFYKDGVNFEGPAPRPLERYAIRISDDGQLEVDKSRIFQEQLGQWKDASSFVPS